MTRKLNMLFAIAALFTSFSAATTVFAEDSQPAPKPAGEKHCKMDDQADKAGQMDSDQMKQAMAKGGCGHMKKDKKADPAGTDKDAPPADKG